MNGSLYVERNGEGEPPVLLLHGLSCNGAVWDRLVALLLQNGFSTIVPDFCGHGRSPWQASYSAGQQAAAIADIIDHARPVRIIAHSMGGAVAMLLASGVFGVEVRSILAIGTKIDWAEADLGQMSKPPALRIFPTREEAAQRFLKVTGLEGLVSANERCVKYGVVETPKGFRLAADPATVRVVDARISCIPCYGRDTAVPIRLSCGSEDRLVGIDSLRRLDRDAILFPGAGHNVHLTDPGVVFKAFLDCRMGDP